MGGALPRWFVDWVEAEGQAARLWVWQPLLVPGLLQTAEYARALFRAWQVADTEEEVEPLVAARWTGSGSSGGTGRRRCGR